LSTCCIEDSALNNKSDIYKLWTEYMRKLHLGQSMDIFWHRAMAVIPGVDEYYTMCALKTGCLARFAAELGALAAGAPRETARYIGEGAEKLGVGFQILDDVKNLTGDISGKRRGDDIVEGKKSLPVLLYLNKNPAKKNIVINAFNEAGRNGITVPEVEELIELLSSSGVLNEAEETARNYIDETRMILTANGNHVLLAGLIDLIS
jgi:octaprenyl-diphosphate synthase